MCSGAIIWSKISTVYFSVSIEESLKLGRNMINLPFEELVSRASFASVNIHKSLLFEKCVNLYREDVRELVKKYRSMKQSDWHVPEKELLEKRLQWVEKNQETINTLTGDDLEKAYKLLCLKLDINPEEAPVSEKTDKRITFHSANFCPSLEACKILDIDTREMCKCIYEKSTEALIQAINPNLRFSRNYDLLRPYADYCEEFIEFKS
jgi:hypothetical protein